MYKEQLTSKQPPNHIINIKLILEQDFTLLAKFPLVSFHADTLPVLRVAIVIFSTKHLLGKTILGVATIIMSTLDAKQFWIIVISILSDAKIGIFRASFLTILGYILKNILRNILRIIGGYLTMTMSGTIWDLALLISEHRKVKTHGTGP